MCEWLSNAEWCDVQLLCGSRSFRAHRAVLASVSDFLKRVLLSCPVDESPLLIFLPEFDQEAMSSVLYYIYKGEVVVPNHKLQQFLDTANAIELYIDQQYIPKMNEFAQYYRSEAVNENVVKNYNICHLKLREKWNGNIINIKRNIGLEDLLCQLKCTFGNFSLPKIPSRHYRWNSENATDLGNMIAQSGSRQRQSFLRDIFIETYSQNGNGNGRTASVLAISNEHYRVPTSVLLPNANGKHPSTSDALSHTSEITSQQNSQTATFHSCKQLQCISNQKESNHGQQHVKILNSVNNKLITSRLGCNYNMGADGKILKKRNSWKTHLNVEIPTQLSLISSKNVPQRQCTSFYHGHTKETLNIDLLSKVSKQCELSEVQNPHDIFNPRSFDDRCIINDTKSKYIQSSRIPEKVSVILNEVLQSPWRPRLPNNYRPFRKKVRSLIHSRTFSENMANVEVKETKDNGASQMIISLHNPSSAEKYEQKCTVCQQVFATSEAHDIHMRRHLPVSRYSCEECHKTFSQLRNFKYHMSIHRGTKEFATTCPVCGKYFNDRGYLSSHMKIHRNRKEYKCPSCPKSFNQRVAYNMHVRIHTGVKPHVCEECGKAFSRKMLLKQHQRTHSGERPYACAHCDKRFADRSNMTLHLRLHTGVKPFSCTVCPKSFTKKHHLKAHLNFHTGAKPYTCPRCKVAFTQSSNMRTHYKKCNVAESNT